MSKLFYSFLFLVFLSFKSCAGADTLSPGQNLTFKDRLSSEGDIFELGFFTKSSDSNVAEPVYLGIWYKDFGDQIIVWVANRDKSSFILESATLKFAGDGNLILIEDDSSNNTQIWSTNLPSSTLNSTQAVLLDDGNFVVRNSLEPSIIYWQSFDHPTDTFLPGAKLGFNKLTGESTSLTAWTSSEDPTPGMFSLELVIDKNGIPQFSLMWNKTRSYWSTGAWDGNKFASVPELRSNYIFNYSFVTNEEESYFTYSVYSRGILLRLVIDQSGQMMQHMKNGSAHMNIWGTFNLEQPRSLDDVYAACGVFGIFNQNYETCQCLQGFKQYSDQGNQCQRSRTLQCQDKSIFNEELGSDGFLKIGEVDLPDNPIVYAGMKRKMCEAACLQNCSCNAYAYNVRGCLLWRGDLINVKYPNGIEDLYLKLAASELENVHGNGRKLWLIAAILVPLTVLILGFILCILYRRKANEHGLESSGEDLLLFDFDGSSTTAPDYDTNSGHKKQTNDFELPFFSFASVSAATRGFSSETKLGEGGFGPVYMGTLLRGQEIAVKRLSKKSGQGVEEFRNEILLIAKLQHRNLVRLLGCCVEQDENILIYEYMPNKSLDYILFGDPSKKKILSWNVRVDIIEGIAQGLLYLHRYSRLRIIHRDLKASNILLDSTMNPRISDFGMARIFGTNVTQANTNRIVGTYGYMAPEYAVEGHFSIKSDVFSFGVLLLEIISGKRNTGFYHSDSLNLLTHAWDLWNVDKGLELLDPTIDNSSSGLKSLRYINIGLLCVQEHPDDRPTMSDIVSMLSNELVLLPTPMKPAFSTWRTAINKNASSNSLQICSVNGLTTSEIKAR